jgi:hypothetical protein
LARASTHLAIPAILATALSSPLATPCADAAEPDRPVVAFVAREGDPRADAMWLAVEAHLNGIAVSVRRVAPEPDTDLAAAAREEVSSGRAAAAFWISETADVFFFEESPFPDGPEAVPIPAAEEGWPSRCALVGSLIVPRADGLVPRPPEDHKPAREPQPAVEPPAPAPAQPPTRSPAPVRRTLGLSLTPRVGLAVPTSQLDPFVIAGLNVDFALPPLERRFSLALDTTYTSPSRTGTVRDEAVAGGKVDFEIRAIEIKWALDFVWRFYDSGRRFAAFLGVGPIAQLVIARERTSLAGGDSTVRALGAGGEIAVAFEWRLGVGGVVADVRYAYSPLAADLLGDTNAGNATAALGYRFEL